MLLIGNGNLITRQKERAFIENGAVAIEGTVIKEVGTTTDLKQKYPDAEFIDAKGGVIMPGFINMHNHIYSSFARGLSIKGYHPKNFMDILAGQWFKLDSKMDNQTTYHSGRVAYLDSIKNGVTTMFDHQASYGEIEGSLDMLSQAADEFGLRTCLCYEVSDRNGEDQAQQAIAENSRFISKVAERQDDMQYAMMGMHAAFTLSDETIRKAREVTPENVGFHIHVAEDLADVQDSLHKYNKPIINRLFDLGILGEKSMVAHCIYINPHEMKLIKDTDTMVVTNPESNMGNAVGCPPAEIERIAVHLIQDKGLHTFIKCNPTLLGYEYARKTMDDLGFDYMAFDDHHLNEDLQFEDAIPMLQRLKALADSRQLKFGVKITNTFPVAVEEQELPSEEMYMSGRSLFPLSVMVAKRLSDAFHGKLQISYSGGADIFNVKDLFEAGIWPITVATTLLKPGGYQRMHQLANVVSSLAYPTQVRLDLPKLTALVEKTKLQVRYQKSIKLPGTPKIKEEVPLINCYTAPCRGTGGCPINQDIPAYLRYVAEGNYLEALKVITDKNPLPFITGTICAHPCETKCTRQFYEGAIDIWGVKLEAAQHAYEELLARQLQ